MTTDVEAAGAAPADLADALLAQAGGGRWWRPRLDVTLSDELARVMVLPWQDGLRTSAQQMCYAEACLDDAGASAASGWTMQYCYRRHGQAGIAYALPVAELERLSASAAMHRLRLRSVLPVSAAAYWRYPLARSGRRLLLLSEAHRYTLLRFAGAALAAVDVQPAAGQRDQALRRLLRRAQVHVGSPEHIGCWSHDDGVAPEQVISECFPAARMVQQPHRSWE